MTDPHATATFDVPGVTTSALRCASCSNRACDALGQIPGVAKVECQSGSPAVLVEFDPARVTEADLAVAMERFGLDLAQSVRHAAWRVIGLD